MLKAHEKQRQIRAYLKDDRKLLDLQCIVNEFAIDGRNGGGALNQSRLEHKRTTVHLNHHLNALVCSWSSSRIHNPESNDANY